MGVPMGNRPINRRPWRRNPFRKRRATEWFDGLSAGSDDRENGDEPFGTPCIIPQLPIICDSFEGESPRSHIRTVWAGPTDAEHIDDSEALIERIVGSLDVRVQVANPNALLLPIVRFGLLAIEEAAPGDLAEYQGISLFQNDHIQDYEWMWLHQVRHEAFAQLNTEPTIYSWSLSKVDIDCRVRRKLGRQDAVCLLASFVTPLASDTEPPDTSVHVYPFLRVLHSVK